MSTTSLETYLAPSATHIRKVGFNLVRLMSGLTHEMLSRNDLTHLSMLAAFHAFIDLGGDPEHPDDFDWSAKRGELETTGLAWLRKDTIGRGSDFSDITKRFASRLSAAFVDTYRWSAWKFLSPGLKPEGQGSSSHSVSKRFALEYLEPSEAECELQAEEVHSFVDALREVTDPQTFQWLVERHRDGVSQETQVDQFIAEHPEYAGETGRVRARNYIDQRISRARRKAADRLDPSWARLAQDVAA